MAQAYALDDGRHELELPGVGRVKTALSPDRLQELGFTIGLPPGAVASNDGAGGVGNVPASRSDVPAEVPGAGGSRGYQDQGGGEGAPASPEQRVQAPPPVAPVEKKPEGPNVGRFGASVERIDVPTSSSAPAPAPAAPRGQMVRADQGKGTDIRTGYSVQKTAATDELPEYEADQALNHDVRMEAERQLGDVKREQLTNEAAAAEAEERYRLRQAEKLQARQERLELAKRDYDARMATLQQEQKVADNLEVDQDRYFTKMGTGGRILAAIGMIASGLTAGLQGGPNQAMEFLHRAYREDIEDQKQRIDARRRGAALRITQLEKTAEALHGDMALAEREVEANHQAYAAALIKKYVSQAGVKNVDPQLLALGAQLNQEAAEKRLQNAAQFGQKVAEQYQWMPDRYVGGAPAAKESDVHQYGRDLEAAGIGEKEGELGEVRDLIDKVPLKDDEQLPTMETRNVLSRKVRQGIDYVAGEGTATGIMDSDQERSAVAGVERIKGKLRHALSGAAVSPQEQEMLDRQMDRINTKAGLREFAQNAERLIARRKAGIRAGITPEAVQTYEGRKRAYDLPRRPAGIRGEQ